MSHLPRIQSNQFPIKKTTPKDGWGLWCVTSKQWDGGAGNPTKGTWEKCAGIKKLRENDSKFVEYKIVPYDPDRK